jgi:hypothetical protein
VYCILVAIVLATLAFVPRVASARESAQTEEPASETSAPADERSTRASDPGGAEALFQKGREAMVAEDYDAACQFFLESLSLDQAVGTVMNLATCEEKRGHLTASWERWHQALRLLDPNDDRVLFAEDQLTWISARLAHLTIRLTGANPKDITIRRDGVVVGTGSLGQELPVDPGEHLVTVEGARYEPKRYTIMLESGGTAELVVSPGPPKAVDAPKVERDGTAQLVGALAAFGVGAAGLTTAIVTGVLLPGKDRKVEQNCPNQMCNEVGIKTISEAQTMLALNTAGWIAAGVGLAGGTVLLLTLPKSDKADSKSSTDATRPPAKSKKADVSAALSVTPTGVLLHGSF